MGLKTNTHVLIWSIEASYLDFNQKGLFLNGGSLTVMHLVFCMVVKKSLFKSSWLVIKRMKSALRKM